jgi:hypothetical protein
MEKRMARKFFITLVEIYIKDNGDMEKGTGTVKNIKIKLIDS